MPLDQRINTEDLVHLHNGVLQSGKKKDILKFVGSRAVVVHAFNPSTQEVEAGGSL